MKKTKSILCIFFFILTISSCSDDINVNKETIGLNNSTSLKYENIPWDVKGKMMEKFGNGISKALQNQKFRELIKTEALKKINGDYDVLYHMIKDKPINSEVYYRTGNVTQSVDLSTLHNFLIPFFESEQELIDFETKLPLLTIFVPELPLDSFSAEDWDVYNANQIPDVAIRLDNITYVPVIGRDEDNYLIAPEDVPSWAIVVLKENERFVSNLDAEYNTKNTRIIDAGDIDIRFSDNNFDPLFSNSNQNTNSGFQGASDTSIPSNLISAYNSSPNDPNAWHRDFTYYGLTPTNPNGPLNGNFNEHIATFRVTGNTPIDAYNSIADAFNETKRDPALQTNWQRRAHGVNAWTDGSFEFLIKCYYGAKASNLGLTVNKEFGVNPDALFQVSWQQRVTGWGFWRKYWLRASITATKTFNTALPNSNIRLEFPTWDLNDFSNQWKLTFEEKDATSTTTTSETRTSKFNANFSLEPSSGLLKKIGLKFGASYEQTQSNTFTVAFQGGNDNLGERVINFRDNPINKVDNNYVLRRFNTGNIEFSFVPLQVQF
jgi:hypothetical protein